jgi:hypothetical protein
MIGEQLESVSTKTDPKKVEEVKASASEFYNKMSEKT